MPNLTDKDLNCIEQLLKEEKRIIEKSTDYSTMTSDAIIRAVCEKSAAQHKNYYETILSNLN